VNAFSSAARVWVIALLVFAAAELVASTPQLDAEAPVTPEPITTPAMLDERKTRATLDALASLVTAGRKPVRPGNLALRPDSPAESVHQCREPRSPLPASCDSGQPCPGSFRRLREFSYRRASGRDHGPTALVARSNRGPARALEPRDSSTAGGGSESRLTAEVGEMPAAPRDQDGSEPDSSRHRFVLSIHAGAQRAPITRRAGSLPARDGARGAIAALSAAAAVPAGGRPASFSSRRVVWSGATS